MAKYRHATLLPSESATTAGTKTIDIDVTDPISMLEIIMKATSAGTAQTAHPAANVSKIEIVDGSTVMASLSGKELQARAFYNTKCMPDNYIADVTGVMAYASFPYFFGRKLWDPSLAFDPAKFKNPQLKITHNYRVADTAASAATLEVYAHMFDEKKISPIGFLRATEHYTYTCAAEGSVETIDLPRDLPIRQMIIHGTGTNYFPWQVANKVKIEENGGAKVPYDFSTSAWLKWLKQAYGRVEEPAILSLSDTPRHVYPAATFTIHTHPITETVTNIVSIESSAPTNPFTLDVTAADEASAVISGYCPHYAFTIPFGDQQDMDDWYDVSPLGSLKMKVTAGSATTNGTVQVVLEQLKKY